MGTIFEEIIRTRMKEQELINKIHEEHQQKQKRQKRKRTIVIQDPKKEVEVLIKKAPGKLRIDHVMPLWSHYLDLINAPIQNFEDITNWKEEHQLDMGDYAKCMAGEAHGFEDDYHYEMYRHYCITCNKFAGHHFPALLDNVEGRNFAGRDWRDSTTVRRFMEHWNEKHIGDDNKSDRIR